MNLASVASVSQVRTQDAVSVVMLRKVLDQQLASAEQMIAGLLPPAQAPDPAATVGSRINTYA
jgi:hypothetical protein